MDEIKQKLELLMKNDLNKLVISKPSKETEFKKIVIEKKNGYYQAAQYTQKQAFHKNITSEDLFSFVALQLDAFRQLNAFDSSREYMLMISKKGKSALTSRAAALQSEQTHDRVKKYILPEGSTVLPLIDMGIFTKEGKVVKSMYDKFRQINRFLEIIDDAVKDYKKSEISIIDFGCGKSYLTFVLYYYFSEIKNIKPNIVGLDLKADVIEKCSLAAKKYGYDGLRFEIGDISGYKALFKVDMVVTLHACDTATDFALYNAVCWDADMIFSVPCCQHELNAQIENEEFSLITRYGVVKERFAALATDALRANLLEACGYKAQLLEFIDFEHTPKNILIRAVKKPHTAAAKKKFLDEAKRFINGFNAEPTLYKLLLEGEKL